MRSRVEGPIPRAIAALAIATALWGLTFPLVAMSNRLLAKGQQTFSNDLGFESAESFRLVEGAAFFVTVRFGASLLAVACIARSELRAMSGFDWLGGIATGVAFAAGIFLQTIALSEISPARSAFLTSLCVVFTPLLAIAVRRERLSLHMMAGALVALAGVGVLTGSFPVVAGTNPEHDAQVALGWGDALTILAAAAFSVQILLIDRFSQWMPAERLTPGMFLATAVGGGAALLVCSYQPEATAIGAWMQLLANPAFTSLSVFLAIACTLWPFSLMNKYQPFVSPAHAALIYALEPIFATLAGVALSDLVGSWLGVSCPTERLTSSFVIGAGMLFVGNLLGVRAASSPVPSPSNRRGK